MHFIVLMISRQFVNVGMARLINNELINQLIIN